EGFPPESSCRCRIAAAIDRRFGDQFQHLAAFGRLRQQLGDGSDQQFSAEVEFELAMAVGQESEVADALKAGRQSVNEKAPDELVGGEAHNLPLAFMPVILPLETNAAILVRHKPLIGYGDAVSVSAQIGEGLLRSAERRLAIHHPFGAAQRSQKGSESGVLGERLEFAEELEGAALESRFEGFEEQAAKQAGQD